MAASDNNSAPATQGAADDGPADDLKALLDILVQGIGDTGARHAETLQDMQNRAAATSDRASASMPELPPELHCEHGAAIERIEDAMSTLAEGLSDAEPQQHHAPQPDDEADCVLPETVRSELRRAIMNAHKEMGDAPPVPRSALAEYEEAAVPSPPAAHHHAFGESGEEIAPPSMSPAHDDAAPPSAPSPSTASMGIEPSWLDQRFADIAERVEKSIGAHSPHNALLAMGARFDQLEQRFDSAVGRITARAGADPDALKAVEQQIGELFTQFNRAAGQLGRLDVIEKRLTDLRQDLSDEQMERLVGVLAPTDEKLSALATAAAERVATTMRDERQAAGASPDAATDARLGELTALLEGFIGDQRQGDTLTAEALDTMQLAMQHLIDRVEAIEAAQIANHDALMRSTGRAPGARPEPLAFSVRTPEPTAANPAEMSAPMAPVLLSDDIPINVVVPTRQPAPSPAQPARAEPPASPLAADPFDRQALIAMARRAAERVSNEAPPPAPGQRAGRHTGLLLAASLVMFLIAGFWMFAGTNLRDLISGFSFGTFSSSDMLPVTGARPRADVDASKDGTSGKAMARHVVEEHVVESHGTTATDGDTAPGKVQLASLSARVVLDTAGTAPATASTADPADSVGSAKSRASTVVGQSSAQAPAQTPAMSRAVEMSPATIGPLSLRLAASKGDAPAQFEVAARFAEGRGVPQDFAQAATWYQRAATHGLATAQYRLGALYERGLGVKADPARARVWYSRAAEQGNVRAMHNLAVLSAGRPGVSPDYTAALQWFTEAASRGLSDSQYNLGILYESGRGVPANNIEAYKWYALAARSGDKDATSRRDAVRTKLDRSSIRDADALVIQWRAMAIEASANDSRVAGSSATGATAARR